MEETIEIVERMIENCKEHFELYGEAFVDKGEIKAIGHLIKAYKEEKEENKILKANHIITHNKASDEDKAQIYDVIDKSIDTYLEKSKSGG